MSANVEEEKKNAHKNTYNWNLTGYERAIRKKRHYVMVFLFEMKKERICIEYIVCLFLTRIPSAHQASPGCIVVADDCVAHRTEPNEPCFTSMCASVSESLTDDMLTMLCLWAHTLVHFLNRRVDHACVLVFDDIRRNRTHLNNDR